MQSIAPFGCERQCSSLVVQLVLVLVPLMLVGRATADVLPKPVAAEFDRLERFTKAGCGVCVAAGGAWCLPTMGDGSSPFGHPPRCVPDARGMCGVGGASGGDDPARHVGIAGAGRCPNAADFEMQAYFHAPRRQPVEPSAMLQAEGASCDAVCSPQALSDVVTAAVTEAHEAYSNATGSSASAGSSGGRGAGGPAVGALAAAFLDCGAVVLPLGNTGVDTDHKGGAAGAAAAHGTDTQKVKDSATARNAALAALRELTVSKLGLAASADAAIEGRARKYLMPGVRGNARAEFVLPATTEFTGAVKEHILTPPVISVRGALARTRVSVDGECVCEYSVPHCMTCALTCSGDASLTQSIQSAAGTTLILHNLQIRHSHQPPMRGHDFRQTLLKLPPT
jgi:hypothetical protein